MTPDELAAAIKAHPFSEVAEDLMWHVTGIALSKSLPFTPVDTGLLRTSETTRVEPGGMRGFVETDVFYSVYQAIDFFALGADASVRPAEDLMQKIGAEYFLILIR